MIHSMTGFGEAHLEAEEQVYSLELRAVNNRYFKGIVRLPESLAFLEGDVERQLREKLTRGTITARFHLRALSEKTAPTLNLAAIRQYIKELSSIGGGEHLRLDLASLALLPGVSQPHELSDAEREQAWTLLAQLIDAAVAKLREMRAAEGAAIAADLRAHCAKIREHLGTIRGRAAGVINEYRDRLHARVRQLLAGSGVELAAADLLREVAIYADRSDISEEIARLFGHMEQFDRYLKSPEPAGRKLEFLAQEMMREANTMGSKTGDALLGTEIIEIKSAVDRIKEQIQNVE